MLILKMWRPGPILLCSSVMLSTVGNVKANSDLRYGFLSTPELTEFPYGLSLA